MRENLFKHVYNLSETIGERCVDMGFYMNLCTARDYIVNEFEAMGYDVELQNYLCKGKEVSNIIVTKRGTEEGEILICGHYDSCEDTPGADDNATAIAGVLEICRNLQFVQTKKTLKFICFTNEEFPHYFGGTMGSMVYAKNARRICEPIENVIVLEMLGCFSDEFGSQQYPDKRMEKIYPYTGDFIFVGGDKNSMGLVRDIDSSFQEGTIDVPIVSFPKNQMELFAFGKNPNLMRSDHVSFQKYSYPAVFVSDTGPFRNNFYHTKYDTWDTLNYTKMEEVVKGLTASVKYLANK